MVLTSLPTVLLQSVMRCCDIRDLLVLSRSCRTALQASSAPFAWSLLSAPLCTLQPDFVGLLSRSLLRFAAAVDLHWLAPDESPWLAAADIDAIASLPRLRRLVAWLPDDDAVPWDRLLLHPCFSELETLDDLSPKPSDADFGETLVSLTRLHTLTLRGHQFGFFDALPRMHSLTHLTVLSFFELTSDLGAIGECVGLVSLTINLAYLPVDLPNMLTVQQVALREVTLLQPTFLEGSVGSLRWCDAFNRPPALSRLSLLACRCESDSVDTLLLALTKWLRPDGPLRVLTLNALPCDRTPFDSILPGLLAALPLLQRLEWEPFEMVRHSPSEMAARVRGTNVTLASQERMGRLLNEAQTTGARLERTDSRITMVHPQPTLTREEQEARLHRKYSAQA